MQNVGCSTYVDGFTFNTVTKIYATLKTIIKQIWQTTFSIEHDKFWEVLFFTPDMMIINLLVDTKCVEFEDQRKWYYIKTPPPHSHHKIFTLSKVLQM